MKLHQLPQGARFEYEGKVYVKTGPITAASDEGGQRMIPRYAVLTPLDGVPVSAERPARSLDETRVLAAFEDFHRTAARWVDEAGQMELASARERFLATIQANG